MTTEARSQVLSVDEAIERFSGQWIFMQVTAEDEYRAPSHGLVLAHHPKRGIIQRQIMEAINAREGGEQFFLFFGERRLRSREEWSEAIDALIRDGS